MLKKYLLLNIPQLKNAKGKELFQKVRRGFSEVKNNVEIRYIKESKTKYVFYTLMSTLTCSILFTYMYERYVLYKWNYQYDYYYNPHLKKTSEKITIEKETGQEHKQAKENGSNNAIDNVNNKENVQNSDKNKKEKEKTVLKNVILVRHGQYERFKGEDSKYLTKEGKKQADITGKKLKDILKNKKINVIYHSNVVRAIETAQIISKYFPDAKLINDSNLDEGIPYISDPLPKNFKFEPQKIKADNKRINKAYETYFYKPDKNEEDSYQLIICHGNVIRYFLCRALQIPLFAWFRFSSYNCGITWLVLDDEGSVVLREFGSVSHLPFESVTYF